MKVVRVKVYSDGSYGRAYLPNQVNESATPPPGEGYETFVSAEDYDKLLDEKTDLERILEGDHTDEPNSNA